MIAWWNGIRSSDEDYPVTPSERRDHAAIRIVIAEDQALVRKGAALLLSMEPDMEVVGQARNGIEAVELVQLLHPDVVLMDLHMPLKAELPPLVRSRARCQALRYSS